MLRPNDPVAAQGGAWPPPPPGPGGYGGAPPGGYGGAPPGGYGGPPPGGYGAPPGGPPRYANPKPITGSPETIAMHALTIDPRTGLPRGEKPPASTASVVALVCGILLCLPFAGIPALIAGTVGRRRAREEPHGVGGANMSLAGIVLGTLNLVLTVLAIVYLIATSLSF